jgi:uroporphyrinogen-III synthase
MPDAAAPLYQLGIAIARPQDQAVNLAGLIRQAGGEPILFPLLAISPLKDYRRFEQQLLTLEQYDWAIFISSNAVQNALPRLLKQWNTIPRKLRFAAIGPSTAKELTKFGVHATLIPDGRYDSESLLALPEMQQVTGQRILIFRGQGGREILAETLRARGASVDYAECYRRINPQHDAGVLPTLWQNGQLHAIVITSSEAMRHLLQIAEQGRAPWLQGISLCVNHMRIAELAQPLHLKIAIADAPGDEAMLQCLIKALTD